MIINNSSKIKDSENLAQILIEQSEGLTELELADKNITDILNIEGGNK